MSDPDRLRELERRVEDIERRLVNMDAAPPHLVEEWLKNAERWAFLLLINQLQVIVPGFSAAALREEFLQLQVRTLDEVFKSGSPDTEAVRAFIAVRVRELAGELFPPPIGGIEVT